MWRVLQCDQVKNQTLYTYCEQVGRTGKDYETKRVNVILLLITNCTYVYLGQRKFVDKTRDIFLT
jgi:hypothetical protein